MSVQESYGGTAKFFHWLIVALLVVQYAIGWLMPDIRRGMVPGTAMNLHISFGVLALGLILVRFLWRLAHPVGPEATLPPWQRLSSEAVHWGLYVLVLATTLTGWMFASMRGWDLTFFWLAPLPRLVAEGSAVGRAVGELHESLIWVLGAAIAIHVLAALVHLFIYRDRVMQRMLPGN